MSKRNGDQVSDLHINTIGTTQDVITTENAQTQVLLPLGDDLEKFPLVRPRWLRLRGHSRPRRMRRRDTTGRCGRR